jgi:hypothetical protein
MRYSLDIGGKHLHRSTAMTSTARYLQLFFQEKDLGELVYEVIAPNGTAHMIPTSVVIERIQAAPAGEQDQIAGIIRKIDFANGDLHHFLRHLATALAAHY